MFVPKNVVAGKESTEKCNTGKEIMRKINDVSIHEDCK